MTEINSSTENENPFPIHIKMWYVCSSDIAHTVRSVKASKHSTWIHHIVVSAGENGLSVVSNAVAHHNNNKCARFMILFVWFAVPVSFSCIHNTNYSWHWYKPGCLMPCTQIHRWMRLACTQHDSTKSLHWINVTKRNIIYLPCSDSDRATHNTHNTHILMLWFVVTNAICLCFAHLSACLCFQLSAKDGWTRHIIIYYTNIVINGNMANIIIC